MICCKTRSRCWTVVGQEEHEQRLSARSCRVLCQFRLLRWPRRHFLFLSISLDSNLISALIERRESQFLQTLSWPLFVFLLVSFIVSPILAGEIRQNQNIFQHIKEQYMMSKALQTVLTSALPSVHVQLSIFLPFVAMLLTEL